MKLFEISRYSRDEDYETPEDMERAVRRFAHGKDTPDDDDDRDSSRLDKKIAAAKYLEATRPIERRIDTSGTTTDGKPYTGMYVIDARNEEEANRAAFQFENQGLADHITVLDIVKSKNENVDRPVRYTVYFSQRKR